MSTISLIEQQGIPIVEQEKDKTIIQQIGIPIEAKPEEEEPKGLSLIEQAGLPVEEPQSEDILGAVASGIKTSVAPSTVTREEFLRPKTTTEAVVEAGAQIATDIATGIGAVALGTAIAGPLGGVGAAVGMALYHGLGYEELVSRAKQEDFKNWRAALNTIVEVNPLFKLWGKSFKFASQAALQSGQALAYDADPFVAGAVGLIGGGVATIAHNKAWDPKGLMKSVDPEEVQLAGVASSMVDPEDDPATIQRLINAMKLNKEGITLNEIRIRERNFEYDKQIFSIILDDELFNKFLNPSQLKPEDLPNIKVPKEQFNKVRNQVRKELQIKGKTPDAKGFNTLVDNTAKYYIVKDEINDFIKFTLKVEHLKLTPNKIRKFTDFVDSISKDIETSKLSSKPITEKSVQSLEKITSKSGYTRAEMYELFKRAQATQMATNKVLDDMVQKGTRLKDPMGFKLYSFFSDIKFAMRGIERVSGIAADVVVGKVAIAKNRHSRFIGGLSHDINYLVNKAKKLGMGAQVKGKEMKRILEAGPDAFTGTPEQKALLFGDDMSDPLDTKTFRGFFEYVRKWGNDRGMNIDWLKDYVSHISKDPVELVRTVKNKVRELGVDAIREGDTNEAKQLYAFFKDHMGVDLRVKKTDAGEVIMDRRESIKLLNKALNELNSGEFQKKRLGFEAFAAFEREGTMPEILQENDIARIMHIYTNNVSKSVHMTPVIKELESLIPALHKLGFNKSVEYLSRYIQSLSGTPSEIISWTQTAINRWKIGINDILDTTDNKYVKFSLNVQKALPDFASFCMAQIYPNYLGFAPHAILRNAAQPIMTLAPEVGGEYGYKLAFKAMISTWKDKLAGVKFEEALAKEGFAPGQVTEAGMNAMVDSFKNQVPGKLVDIIEAWGNASMYLYGKGEMINRYTTRSVAKELTKDIKNLNPSALKFLGNMSEGHKTELYRFLKQKDFEGFENTISQYLLSKTMFDYGSHAMSEYGRAMGRYFSMFTKWPTMIFGDIGEALGQMGRTGSLKESAKIGTDRILIKYFTPLAALMALDRWMDSTSDDPRRRLLVGQNWASWAAADAMGVSVPPSIKIATDAGKSFIEALDGDFAGAAEKFGRTLLSVTPGYGVLRTATRGYEAYTGEEAPEWAK